MITPRIDSITYSVRRGQARKKPKAGDERFLKGRQVTQIRQQKIVNDPLYGWCHVVNSNGPVYEWVDKGSDRDRTSEAWKAKRKAERGGHDAD